MISRGPLRIFWVGVASGFAKDTQIGQNDLKAKFDQKEIDSHSTTSLRRKKILSEDLFIALKD
jgi:hypothetical protein